MNRKHDDRAACAVFCVLVSLLGGCGKQTEEEVETETVVSVKTEAASLGDIRGVVHATGVVNPAPGADLVVVAPEAARISEIPKAPGDSVRRGDLLVRFEIPMAAAEVQRQQAEVARAEAALRNAKAAQARAADLFQRGIAARKEVEDADRAVADAEAAVAQARASLGAAETVAARATVRATFDGIVAKRQHNPGDLVEATASDPVLRVIDPRRLEVVASVPLADVTRIELGAPAHLVETPADAREIKLKVLSRPAAVETGTATIPVRVGFSAPPNLPAGTPVQVEIEAEHHKGVVLIPAVAVVREGDETGVFIATGGKAERRPVTLGLNDGTRVEIVSGVKADEQVIVDGQAGLPDGAAISVTNEPTGAPESRKGAAAEKDGPK
jgi:RND family efflux transporter MFP subunit